MVSNSVDLLLQSIHNLGYQPVDHLPSIVLVGGLGNRLAASRKRITPAHFPTVDSRYWNTTGPKGLAVITARLNGELIAKPLTDWHLDIHTACNQISEITLALGSQAGLIQNYYETKHHCQYNHRKLRFLVEKNPAGTLAPLIHLFNHQLLPNTPLVYANGDSLIDIDLYEAYLQGLHLALQAKLDLQKLVIMVATLLPAELTTDYGTLAFDPQSFVVKAFCEKSRVVNPEMLISINGQLVIPINAGFSIINNPTALFSSYLTKEVAEISGLLNAGLLDYAHHETLVKYETLYSKVAADGQVIVVLSDSPWCDLGTEERIQAAETDFFTLVRLWRSEVKDSL